MTSNIAISKFHNSSTSPGPDSYQSEPLLSKPQPSTEHPLDQFCIHLESPVFQTATEQTTFQEETHHQTPNPLKESFTNARSWTSTEGQQDYEAEPDHSSNANALFDVHFLPMSKNKHKFSAPHANSTSPIKKGWAIAASSFPVSIQISPGKSQATPTLTFRDIWRTPRFPKLNRWNPLVASNFQF